MMMFKREYKPLSAINVDNVRFAIHGEYNGKPNIQMYVMQNERSAPLAFVMPACVTHWPRCTGNGNIGTKFGPFDPLKAKFTLDLTDDKVCGEPNAGFAQLKEFVDSIDDKLLELVFHNQEKCLSGRRNLSRQECAILQNRSIKPKYDNITGSITAYSMSLGKLKYHKNTSTGEHHEFTVNICDHSGAVLKDACVKQGDVVSATAYVFNVYTGVGDKFGISWGFEDVCVVRQGAASASQSHVAAFALTQYPFASDYVTASTHSEPAYIEPEAMFII